ncbi:CxC2 domain-containing protein [Favolaschia claudopus]|uniref:CxC2 domain-containing protein n=1 Tax=Favolaschia claudopus TaxID=2862362 RepID=A0AAW0C885_9AGAR
MGSRAQKFKKRKRGVDVDGEDAMHTLVHAHEHVFSLGNLTGRSANAPIVTLVDRVSTDNRRHYQEELPVEPGSPVKRHRQGHQPPPYIPPPTTAPNDVTQELYEMGFDLGNDDNLFTEPLPSELPEPKIVKPADPVLHRFRDLRDIYLGIMLRRDGCRNAARETCRRCNVSADPRYRCRDCFGDDMLCQDCVVDRHAENPLHRIEWWNDLFFEPSSLKDAGLVVQLGHRPRERCGLSHPFHVDFVVLHTNGIHRVAARSCQYEHRLENGEEFEQLLRAGWFPATDDRPRTCATFAVLDLFVKTTHQAKTTMYDFYGILQRLTNHTGIEPPNPYKAWLRMAREYRHLLMLKRVGRGHDAAGVKATQQGQLVVRCPCCPDPDVNLPADWAAAGPEERFLYIIFIAIDACFRLKRRLISSELKDPSLGPGWSYFVESGPYRKYLLTVTDQVEMSTCSGLAALDYANTKFSRGYSATGVGMGVCARHEIVFANGVGDLQRGERYANMDWIFACILFHLHAMLRKIISYDIACQWWINLVSRIAQLPPGVRLHLILAFLRFVIPKLHIHGHKIACQLMYSLNLIPGSGQTDGEGIERPWYHIGAVGPSTCVSGPGAREDNLNCHWGFWNWEKLLGLGERLRTRLDRARNEHATQLEGFTQFSTQQEERVPEWRQMVVEFEADESKPNPYAMTEKSTSLTEAQVLLRFEKEEEERVRDGVPCVHAVSPSSFIAAGLDVEDEQPRVRVQVELKKAGTTAQEIDLAAIRRKLTRSIQRLRKLQASYTPAALLALDQRQNVPDDEQPENTPLFLPSALTDAQRAVEPLASLAIIESSLRDAQCSSALVGIRTQLHVKSRLLTYKEVHARHQGANTRSRALVTRNETKIRLHSEKYQMAWEAMRRLEGGDAAKVGWRVLRKEDIRCMEDAEELQRNAAVEAGRTARRNRREDELRAEGELPPMTASERAGRLRGSENVREVSWIWTSASMAGSNLELEEALRIEWVKAWARTRRWEEEIRLVEEEVRRFPISLEHRAKEWERRISAENLDISSLPVEQAEGAVAYALKQAAMCRDIARRFGVTMKEERRGRGKKRVVIEDEDAAGSEDEEEQRDARREQADEELLLEGGADVD